MRIGYLVSKYPAISHTFILREVLSLRRRGMEIEVASINEAPPRNELTREEQAEAERTLYVKRQGARGVLRALLWAVRSEQVSVASGLRTALGLARHHPRKGITYMFYLAEALLLAQWMDARALSHLHVHFASQAATVGLILTHIAPISFSMTVHGPDEFFDVEGQFLEQKIRRSRFIVCISFFAQSQMMRLSAGHDWGKYEVVRLGVDPHHFGSGPLREQPSLFRVLCVGRLVPAKGHRVLLAAVKWLLNEGRELELVIVGDGPDRPALETFVSDHDLGKSVHFEGALNQDRIREQYRSADVFALMSFAEGIPVVLMEAMAMEIPCISTWVNGIPELIHGGTDGWLLPPSDVEGTAAAIAQLMDDPKLRRRLGQAARERVMAEYDLSANADRLRDVFLSRLGARE